MPLARNKQLVADATNAFFNLHDASAVDRYVVATYTQHSALIGNGPQALRDLIANLAPDVSYKNVRLLADGDLVAAHGIYTGFGDTPLVAFDIFRVSDGKLTEHWDGLQPQSTPNPSGHTMTDGPTTITDLAATDGNRSLVESFVDAILIGAQYDRLTEFISTESYVQHNPQIADGLDGLGAAVAALTAQGLSLRYNARHRTVAESDFVFIQSDGEFGRPVVYYDLFRVEDGKIVEHWDVIQDVVTPLLHNNGQF